MRTATPAAKAKPANVPAVALPKKTTGAEAQDAVSLLKQDHKNVNALFGKFESLGDTAFASKKKLPNRFAWN